MRTAMKSTSMAFSKLKLIALLFTLLISVVNAFATSAASNQATEPEHFSNPLFMVFAFVILFLLIIIIVLADVVKGSARIMMNKKKNGAALIILFFLANSLGATAQEATAIQPTTFGGLSAPMFYLLSFVVIFEVGIIVALIFFIRSFLGINDLKPESASELVSDQVQEPSILEKLNASVALEDEAEILLDHNYDGIQELDNNLPPWWKYGFYLTIVFAFIYLLNYHVFKTGDLQGAEYTKELEKAAADIAEYQKKSALSVDENSVKLLVDESSLNKGKDLYMNNCVACHGKLGEGQVGPNLTDDYWLHGGKVNDVFKTIKYGYPDKGMKSWKEDFSPSQIACLTSFIKTLQGTNPPNAKEKQGELYVEEASSPEKNNSDSLATDSIKGTIDSLTVTKK